MDYHLDNATKLVGWLKSEGYTTGQFMVEDIFKLNPKPDYDLVCSFGLIEHFVNFKDVIKIHCDLVKPGGKLMITTPNIRGWV